MRARKFAFTALAVVWFCVPFTAPALAAAQTGARRYALILEDPPVSQRFSSREAMRSGEARSYQQQLEARQQALRKELAARHIEVTGSVTTLLNAVFVIAPASRLSELKSLPGVIGVTEMKRRFHPNLNQATQLLNGPAAWNALGGTQNAGAGIKIAILDSGIDQTHPAFQDSSLAMPAGYPICSGNDCNFTNNKVIVARSYVRQLAAGTDPSNPAADSRPDDYSPRDRDGHGTAVASCAAGNSATGTVQINGMAPKAYLGNYKIYGSPEVNDATTDDVIIQALDDAVQDGMDIVSFSTGGPAFTGPLDSGTVCGNDPGVPCDLVAQAFENAVRQGTVIVASAGNGGEDGVNYPSFSTVASPADAPSVIGAGATTNSHVFQAAVIVAGSGVPSNLQNIAVQTSDSYLPSGTLTAPLRDVSAIGGDPLACTALPAHSLDGAFALIERGSCTFAVKMNQAVNAGASGVIFYMADASPPIAPSRLSAFNEPAVMIANSDGMALKDYEAANPDHPVIMSFAAIEQATSPYNQLAGFSSLGPGTGNSSLKPDVVAVGTSVYMAAQSYDPLGALYSSDGFAVADGTSFAAPLAAGTAALVKQSHPSFTAIQIRSALIDTASQDVTTDEFGDPVDTQSVGAGKIDAGAAISATVTFDPATLSFGALTGRSFPAPQTLNITNAGSSPASLALAVSPNSSSRATVSLDRQTLSLGPGESGTVRVSLGGSFPGAGSYSGTVSVTGPGVSMRVPYLYLVGDGVPANIIPLSGMDFDGTVGEGIPDGALSFKLVDDIGLPIAGVPVSFIARGGGTLVNADGATDAYGIAAAEPMLGSVPGNYSFVAVAGGLRLTFSGTARVQPAIAANGIANAANGDNSNPFAPGSYIAISGAGLSDVVDYNIAARLPLALDYVIISFDVPSAGISVPGHIISVSPSNVQVQVPWELQGQTSAQVKVTIDYSNGNLMTIQLADYAPGLFESSPGVAMAADAGGTAISASNPAHSGQAIKLFADGLGPVTNQPASGDPASPDPPSVTIAAPLVTIGGMTAAVSSSALSAGTAGVYEIDVTVPGTLGAGTWPVTISAGGHVSRASNITLQ